MLFIRVTTEGLLFDENSQYKYEYTDIPLEYRIAMKYWFSHSKNVLDLKDEASFTAWFLDGVTLFRSLNHYCSTWGYPYQFVFCVENPFDRGGGS